MRAIKSSLIAAAYIKVHNKNNDNEETIILKALCDINLPKFITSDRQLFFGIIKDIFPNIPLKNNDMTEFYNPLIETILELEYQ